MPSLEWLGHVPTAVSAVHALVALVSLCRRSPAGRPGVAAKAAVQEQCGCGVEVVAVRVEVEARPGVVVRVAVDGRTAAGVGGDVGVGVAIGGERGPW